MKRILAMIGLGVVLAFTLFFSYEMKRPCLEQPWGAPLHLENRNLCYNDIQGLYGVRNLSSSSFPYVVEKGYEYPVLMGLAMWSASLFAHDNVEYFKANVPLLTLSAFLVLIGLIGAMGPRRHILWFAASTPLLFYAYLNWDLIPVACVALAMWAWSRRKLGWAGAALGLGVSAKFYPAFLLPSLIVMEWRENRKIAFTPGAKKLILGASISWLAVNLPIIVAEFFHSGSISGWAGVFTFHTRRVPDFGTWWHWLPEAVSPGNRAYLWLIPCVAIGWGTAWLSCGLKPKDRYAAIFAGSSMVLVLAGVLRSNAILHGANSIDYRALVDQVSGLGFVFGSACLLFRQWRSQRDPWTTGGAILALYLLLSKIHSPQHTLWILPMMIVVNLPWSWVLLYCIADLMSFVGVFNWFATSTDSQSSVWQYVLVAGVVAKSCILIAYIGWCAFRGRDRIYRRNRAESTQRQTSKLTPRKQRPAA